ncbi:MAG: ATP-binding cassette domain-containing protein, partial [Actinobacteria bacterium]|nr:ATP-binding cassette domain-containing protein [Actinomycetota bacterium]
MSSQSLLSISNLTVKFGGLTALDDVYLNLESNQVVGLIGPNGAGKTTLFNAICGIVKPTSGSLALNGQDHDWPATHELTSLGISRTLQGVGLYPDLTVAENVMIGAQKYAKTGLISAGFG